MEGLYFTAHATSRMSQRGIQRDIVDVLLAYGRQDRSRGADVFFMDKRGRQQALKAMGRKAFAKVENRLDAYLVVSDDGALITTARRLRRFRR